MELNSLIKIQLVILSHLIMIPWIIFNKFEQHHLVVHTLTRKFSIDYEITSETLIYIWNIVIISPFVYSSISSNLLLKINLIKLIFSAVKHLVFITGIWNYLSWREIENLIGLPGFWSLTWMFIYQIDKLKITNN